jgi:hypothetical protein
LYFEIFKKIHFEKRENVGDDNLDWNNYFKEVLGIDV